jgi:hypothetical protein
LEFKKNAFPGGQALQRGLMGLKIKANRLRKEKCTFFFFFNLFHIILFIPYADGNCSRFWSSKGYKLRNVLSRRFFGNSRKNR